MGYSAEDREKFRTELKVRIYRWTVRLVKYIRQLRKRNDASIWSILDQVLRSGTSVCANYIEAIGSPTTKDFRNVLAYALKSANETKFWLALVRDSGIDAGGELEWLLQEIIEISKILGKSVSTLYKNS